MSKLAIFGGEPVINADDAGFSWPQYDSDDEKAVIEQMRKTVSIYDNSGIFGEFEESFAKYHGADMALLSNSGTSAIFSMFEGLGLKQGDEVICPVYTFHATVSPLMYTGATPVFCDSDYYGNISLDSIREAFTEKTKAIIITHMWGNPVADIEAIRSFCDNNDISLLEDCSHAHGARINGKVVGSIGDAAAWSLQGQKPVTGGEGGIMTTSNKKIFNRALLQGHYNKRPKMQIEKNDPLYEYYLTGFGQKFRAHPIAVRLALRQFKKLDEYLIQRAKYSQILSASINGCDFLEALTPQPGSRPSNYALIFRYNADCVGVSRQKFVEALLAEGLVEVDVPGSTGMIHQLPLFTDPHKVLPRLYNSPISQQGTFDNASRLCDEIIKLPVWTFESESKTVHAYAEGFKKVTANIEQLREL